MASRSVFTSESVSMGHPDKMCDQISDAVLDAMLAQDPTLARRLRDAHHDGLVVVAGEVTTRAQVEIAPLVRRSCRTSATRTRRWASTPAPAPCWSRSAGRPPTSRRA